MFLFKTKQTQQTDGEAMVQCSLDGFRVLSLNFGGKWKKLAESRIPEMPTFRMYDINGPLWDQILDDRKKKNVLRQRHHTLIVEKRGDMIPLIVKKVKVGYKSSVA